MSKWLRLHMIEDEVVDIKVEGLGAQAVKELATSDYVTGEHAGGKMCYVPQSSIIWVETIDINESGNVSSVGT